MSISAISSSNPLLQTSNPQNLNQQQNTEFQKLTQALQSGNLISAQQAFSALSGSTATSGLQSLQLTQDLNKLGSALQSGNLNSARQAYSTVQQNLQSPSLAAHHNRGHHDTGSQFLTSGFPGSSSLGSLTASNVFQPLNLTA
jgi:6-phosphogluconate dehydrogenase